MTKSRWSGWKKFGIAMFVGATVAACATIHRGDDRSRVPAGNAPTDEFSTQIKPILDSRCIVCHSCYNAPCQLNLTAYEGLERGGSKELVYHSERLKTADTTRLFEDASSTAQWRKMGFHSVIDGGAESIMAQLVAHKTSHPTETGNFAAEESATCAKDSREAQKFLRKNSFAGMPYGFPALSQQETQTLTSWLSRGAEGPNPLTLARLERPSYASGEATLLRWENFLNQEDPRVRIVARYIYEHLFLAHVHFDDMPEDFFRLVRASNRDGDVREVATRRPYDDPKTQIYYRFRRITGTIVRKTHIIYHLSDAKMAHLKDLFLNKPWANNNPAFPSYKTETAANPFVSFKDIPAKARYQFLLDDAFYHVMTFIRGPVCKGNTALNVIDAHFNILFLNPDSDPTVTDPDFLLQAGDSLKMPGSYFGDIVPKGIIAPKMKQLEYLKLRQALYKKHSAGRTMRDLWDGGGTNNNAVLTVYRHFESADVMIGAHGGTPKTVWVMDYPIFERIYYDLVAGFDVYGNADHQLGTRFYMNNLRIESEDNFLTFMPQSQRIPMRKGWYRGKFEDNLVRTWMKAADPYREGAPETAIAYQNPVKAKEEFLEDVRKEFSEQVRGEFDRINTHDPEELAASNNVHSQEDIEQELAKVTKAPGDFPKLFPDVSLVRIHSSGDDGVAYTLIHNKAFFNVMFILTGDHYYDPANDDLHIIRGIEGSHPNFFFDVKEGQLGDFLNELRGLHSQGDYAKFVARYGVRRMDAAKFWPTSDWFNSYFRQNYGIEAGVLDLSRYTND